jgi:class 3 adenylate cyclase/tetratricopeptide (TPR) repeat protein
MREERRTVTALFADVAGSTALGERLDPEDVREVVGDAVRLMIDAVDHFGGTVKDVAGDGVLAFFGAPVAHEDDIERAVLAGLEIQRSIAPHAEAVRRDHGIASFGVRVGIECGLVVTGPVGGGSRVEYGATGDAVNIAARLQARGSIGSVLVGPRAHAEVEPLFTWSEPRALELVGKAEPVHAAEALEPRRDGARLRHAGSGTPLVGRDPELAAGAGVVERLASGAGGGLLIAGEAGFGKTRLLEAIREHSPPGVRWLDASCTSIGSSTPYAPIRELLDGWRGLGHGDRRPEDLVPSAVAEVRAALAVLSGTADADAATAFAALSPEGRQLATVDGLRSFLLAAARETPLALAIEDLHWCDASSLQALERLLPLGGSDPVAFVITTRPEPDSVGASILDRAIRGGHARRIELHALPPGSDRALVASLVGEGSLPPALLERLLETGSGNPFFLGELVRSLIDAGTLVPANGGWSVAASEAMPPLPPTVERVLLARIDRLPDEDRGVLTAAAVLGRRFRADALADLLGRDPGAALRRLSKGDLVRAEPPDHAFAHVLVQETAYATLLRKRRRELHARAAAAIEAAGEAEAQAAVLARHHAGAGNTQDAVRWFVLAADRAQAVSALIEAITDLDRALGLVDPNNAVAAELRLRRGRLRGRTGDHAGARTDLEEALRLAEASGDRSLEMRCRDELGFLVAGAADYRESVDHLERALAIADELGDTAGRVSALSRLAITWANRAQLDRAQRSGDLAFQTASAARDEGLIAVALDALKLVALLLGRLSDVERHGEELRRMYSRRNDRWLEQFVDLETAFVSIAGCRFDEARERLDRALATNRELHDDGNEPLIVGTFSPYHRCRGDVDEAVGIGRRALVLARERAHAEWIASTASQLGGTLLQAGVRDEAVEVLREGVEAAERSGAEMHNLRCAGMLVRTLARLEPGDGAPELLRSAEAKLRTVRVPTGEALLFAWDGAVGIAAAWLARSDPKRAVGTIEPMLRLCVERSWPEAVVDASLVQAAALAALEDRDGALAAARRADEWSRRHGLALYAWRAQAALSSFLADGDSSRIAADRASASAAELLDSVTDASVRGALQIEIERVLDGEGGAWA